MTPVTAHPRPAPSAAGDDTLTRRVGAYVARVRLADILVLQGSPLLGAAFAGSLASRSGLPALALLALGNLCLVAHVFLLNDWSGLRTDAGDPNKAARVFAARGVGRKHLGALAAATLAGALPLFARLGGTTLALATGIVVLSALYSLPALDWKGKPFLNTAAHVVGGGLQFLLGYALGGALDRRGLCIAVFFGLVFAAGHLTQEVRDYEGDALNGIRTNAVVFGRRRTFAGALGLFALAHATLLTLALTRAVPRSVAGGVVLLPVQLAWSLAAFRGGLDYARVSRLQVRYRLLYALLGLGMLAAALRP